MLIHEYATVIATAAHSAVGQTRKYTGDPYIVHPEAVVNILKTHCMRRPNEEMLATAWLHDVLEDTKLQRQVIAWHCGSTVAGAVEILTNSPHSTGNRKQRKAIDNERLSKAPGWVQTVKVADLIDNTRSIVKYDPDFAKVYMREKAELLTVLTKADPALLAMANNILNKYFTGEDYYEQI